MKGLMEEGELEKRTGEERPVRRKIGRHAAGGECAEGVVWDRECICGMLPPDQVKPELETAHWIQQHRRCRRGGGSPGIRRHHAMAAGVNAPELRKRRLNSLWKCGQ